MINRRLLRVLDAEVADGRCYVVNEWGQGDSLDNLLTREGPLAPRRAAWLVGEVADSIAEAHDAGLAHGCLTPENVLIDLHGQVRIIGFGVEAALRGLPAGRISVDEIDLAGLLYCALTGKWAGVSGSGVPRGARGARRGAAPATGPGRHPADARRPVRPGAQPRARARRAGSDYTARRIRDLLHDYVGDVAGTPLPVAPGVPLVLTPAPTPTVPDGERGRRRRDRPGAGARAGARAGPHAGPRARSPTPSRTPRPSPPRHPSTDLPTQAGMPVFHDDDEVDWLRARADKPAPPPPLDDPTPKPLFAPDPPDGEPVRRPRPGSRAATGGQGYWPWDASQDSSVSQDSGVRPPGRDTGSWSSGSWSSGSWTDDRWGTGDGLDDTGEQVPGRSWIRLAMIVGICLLVGVAAVAAYQLGLKPPTPGGSTDEPTTSASPTAAEPTPFTDLVADDFDPQGAPPREENPDQVPNVLDGDPATAWTTSTYQQNFGPGGLKSGVGLIIDLGTTRAVRQVVVTTAGGQTALAAYVTSEAPTGVAGLTPVGTASGDGPVTIELDEAVSGRYVTVWLTLIPAVDDGFRGTISEVQVLG